MRTTAPISIVRHGYTYVRLPSTNEHGGLCQLEIDPNVQCGEPCIRSTRIPAWSVWAVAEASGIAYVCGAYGITERQAQACIDYVNAPLPARPSAEKGEG